MDDGKMSFTGHLEELRTRILRAAFAVLLGMVVVWNYRERFHAWMLRPLEVAWFCRARGGCEVPVVTRWMLHPDVFRTVRAAAAPTLQARAGGFPVTPQIHWADPTAGFVAYLKLAAIGGFVLALPVVFYQLWSFIAPGLYPKEKRLALPFVFFSTLFFVSGALFGYYLVFPSAHEYFLSFSGTIRGTSVALVPTIMMDEHLSFSSQMLFAFGVVFQLPLFIFFLSLAGLVTWRQLLNFGRYFTVIAFIVAAILTPTPDMFSQVMLGLPLVALYFVAVFLAYLFGPKEARAWRSTSGEPAAKPAAPTPAPAPTKPAAPSFKLTPVDKPLADKAPPRTAPSPEELARIDSARAEKIRKWEEEQKQRKS
jgi:sec-independent protein translocase protein TatC